MDFIEEAAPLRRQAEDALRQRILSGELSPGDRLKERELVELLGVSRTSIREALRQIEAEGLVTLEPNRGPVVSRLSYEDVEDLYEARGALEAQACIGFASRATSRHMLELQDAFGALRALALSGDVEGTVRLSDRFYDAILEGSGNRLLKRMLRQLHNRIVLLRRTSLSEADRLPETLAELTRIFDALVARDDRAAAAASRHHVQQAERVALRVIRNAGKK